MSTDTAVPAAEAKAGLRGYFADLTATRRRTPSGDLISALATAHIGDDALSAEELAVLAMLLLVAGHDTTTYQIGNIVYTLLTRPDALAWIRGNRDKLPEAIEELLRHIPFRQGVGIPRVATHPHPVADPPAILVADHPQTLTSRNNLAYAYGRRSSFGQPRHELHD